MLNYLYFSIASVTLAAALFVLVKTLKEFITIILALKNATKMMNVEPDMLKNLKTPKIKN